MRPIVNKLRGGDRRSIGRADEVAREIAKEPALFGEVFAAMVGVDPVVRMRAADAVEKATAMVPDLLQPYKRQMLRSVAAVEQHEVRWHVAQMLPRLRLTSKERARAVSILVDYLEDESRIVRTCAMQALADLAVQDARLRERVVPLLLSLTATGSPAMRARGRKLLRALR